MNTSESLVHSHVGPLISHETYELLMAIALVPLFFISLLGIVTNIVNVLVFAKQGPASDSTTVSLMSLAVSDLLGCFFSLPQPVCFFLERYVPSESVYIRSCFVLTTMSAAYPHIICTQITIWITVYISVERAVCVIFPLKVKQLVKTKNTKIFMIIIYAVAIIFHIPFASNSLIIFVSDPANNGTVTAINYQTPLGAFFYRLNNMLRSNIFTTLAIFIVAIATITMVTRLKASRKWRASVSSALNVAVQQKSQTSGPSSDAKIKERKSTKEAETVKVVICITSIFIACLTFSHLPGLVMYIIPGYAIDGTNRDLFHFTYSLKFVFDALNSALNFFFYVRLSTKYRKSLQTFCCHW